MSDFRLTHIGDGSRYLWDYDLESKIVRFLAQLKLTKSTKSGLPEPVVMLPFMEAEVLPIFCCKRKADGLRRYRKVFSTKARKNAKTQEAAIICLIHIFLDDEEGAEAYMVATDHDQSEICYSAASAMIQTNEDLEELCAFTNYRKLIKYGNRSIRALSSKGKHGFNPSLVIFDELHSWRPAHQELMDAMISGSRARKQPLFVFITTAGTDRNSICFKEYEYAKKVASGEIVNESYLACIHELPADADWRDRTLWHLANPGLGTLVSIESIEDEMREALNRPEVENRIRRLTFNQWTDAETTWLPGFRWAECRGEFPWDELAGVEAYGGLDLGATRDLTAFALMWPLKGKFYLKVWYWIPDADLKDREDRDGVPYSQWAKQGHLTITQGNQTDFLKVSSDIQSIAKQFRVRCIAYDRAMAADTAQRLTNDGHMMVAHGQGYLDMSPPAKRFEGHVYDRTLIHQNDPLTSWNMACCTIKTDEAGNIKPVKPDRLASSRRIDGIVASIMAFGAHIKNPKKISVYQLRAEREAAERLAQKSTLQN